MRQQQEQDQVEIELLQDLAETSRLMDLDNLSQYEKDVRKTVLLYHGNNKFETQQDVADHLDVSRNTVDNRLHSDEARQFMKMFSHRDKDELDRWFEELAAKHYNKAMKGLKVAMKRASQNEGVSPQVLKSCSQALLKADEQFAKNLQEFGAIQKPKERKKVEKETDSSDLRSELAEYYEDKEEDGEKG